MAKVETIVAIKAKMPANQTVEVESSAPDPVPGRGPSFCRGAVVIAEIISIVERRVFPQKKVRGGGGSWSIKNCQAFGSVREKRGAMRGGRQRGSRIDQSEWYGGQG